MWTRDCLLEDLQQHYWAAASYTLASGISWAYKSSDYDFWRVLVPHINACISLCKDGPIVSCYSGSDRIEMVARFALAYGENGRLWSATELREKVLEASQRTLGSEHLDTLGAMNSLANSYSDVGRRQEAMELSEKVLEASQRTLGSKHPDTLRAMNNLANMPIKLKVNKLIGWFKRL
jgi:tetratricopeptide (TPR) repeat protein